MINTNIKQLEDNLEYKFKNINYLKMALTHSSFANESKNKIKSNERLEFLGDSILGIVVAEYIFLNCPNLPEGELSKMRASLVCEKSLCGFSKSLNVGDFLRLSHGEMNSKGNERPSILADAFEAIIAAIYLDGGMENAREFILGFIKPCLSKKKTSAFKDYKTILQEIVQQNKEETISYALVKEAGPDHDKHFEVEVRFNTNVVGKGGGRSKKEAEQQAAREALRLMGY
ncbi:MAG: Ribonuclease 3 [Eubacteriales bacterium SKADARSKE-1]|nr:Ribonuclease 3 [Eubacteriales bacterium SKADARSKE-1]